MEIKLMSTVGIIAEFNPFHNGHRYILDQAKKITGADTCAVIMSGSFVQRGAPAICDKYLRTRFALENGADIVLELPTCYSTGSAEAFADGAVRLLTATGVIDYLVFGSENGDIVKIKHAAEVLEKLNHTESFNSLLSAGIRQGLSFPAARTAAIKDEAVSELLSSPNNILAVEYCRALYRLSQNGRRNKGKIPVPVTIKREGQAYSDSIIDENTNMASAGAIRQLLTVSKPAENNQEEKNEDFNSDVLNKSVPETVAEAIRANYQKLLPITEDDFSSLLFFRLNTAADEELMSIPDINPDLLKSILKHRRETLKITELIAKIKSKAFTYTAISRALFRILLYIPAFCRKQSITEASGTSVNSDNLPQNNIPDQTEIPSLRVLGFRIEASGLLKQITDAGTCRLVTTPSSIDRNDTLLMQDVFAAELYSQVTASKYGIVSDSEFTKKVIIY